MKKPSSTSSGFEKWRCSVAHRVSSAISAFQTMALA
jgi:hypothetical protein